MNWRRDRDNGELLGREVEGPEEKRWVMVVGTGVIFMILRSLSLDDTCLHANRLQPVLPTNVSSLSPFRCQTIIISSGTFDFGLALLDLDTLQHDWRQISPGGGGVGRDGGDEGEGDS